MPALPITIVFFLTGIAVWANALFFLGIGSKPASDDASNPLVAVGWITLLAGFLTLSRRSTSWPPAQPHSAARRC